MPMYCIICIELPYRVRLAKLFRGCLLCFWLWCDIKVKVVCECFVNTLAFFVKKAKNYLKKCCQTSPLLYTGGSLN